MKRREMEKHTDDDVTVRALKHLIHTLRTEGGSKNTSDGFTGGDVSFLSIETTKTVLRFLFSEDNERPSVLVESQRHIGLHGHDPKPYGGVLVRNCDRKNESGVVREM